MLDYFEGKLLENDVVLLKSFLMAHPELDVDLSDSELPYFKAETIGLDSKQHLKKTELKQPDEQLLNYLENNLSAHENYAFEEKLRVNAKLRKDLEQYKKTILSSEKEVVLSDKSGLHKTESDLSVNNRVIAYFEGELGLDERVELEKELAASVFVQRELELVSKTKLQVEHTIVYPDKNSLKKENTVIALFGYRTVTSIAAAILLLIGLFVVFNYFNPQAIPAKELARVTKTSTQKLENTTTSVKQKKEAKKLTGVTVGVVKQVAVNTTAIKPAANSVQPDKTISKDKDKSITNEDDSFAGVKKDTTHNVYTDGKEQLAIQHKTLLATETTIEPIKQETPTNAKKGSTDITTFTEDYDTDEIAQLPERRGFWRKVADFAMQANKLGVKTIDVEESSQNRFVLSFNQFSVEKK